MNSKIKILTCVTKDNDYCGFNEIIESWEDKGYITREFIPQHDGRFCVWVGRKGGLVLEPSDIKRLTSISYEYALCAQYREGWENDSRLLPWNFWPKTWNIYRKVSEDLKSYVKKYKSIFSGTIRSSNPIKRDNWIGTTEIFSWRPARSYRRVNNKFPSFLDYYIACAETHWGLALCGDAGGKCAREIEYLGLGTSLIVTPGIQLSYYAPIKENEHYIFASNPVEMNEKISNISLEQEEYISNNGVQYFKQYCTPDGLWNSVLKTIELKNIKVN